MDAVMTELIHSYWLGDLKMKWYVIHASNGLAVLMHPMSVHIELYLVFNLKLMFRQI